MNKFRNAEAFVNAGAQRLQSMMVPNSTTAPGSRHREDDIREDISDRISLVNEEIDDNASSLSKELLMAKQNLQL